VTDRAMEPISIQENLRVVNKHLQLAVLRAVRKFMNHPEHP